MAQTTHETPKARGMTKTWGMVALVVVIAVLAMAWFFGLFDGEPTGTVLSEASSPVALSPGAPRAG